MKGQGPIAWRTIVHRVDIETGFFLTEREASTHYTLIKQNKEHETNRNRTRGTTTITKLYKQRDRIQGNLFD